MSSPFQSSVWHIPFFFLAPSQSDDLPMEEAARLINTLVTRMQDERPENELEWALRQPQFQRIKTASI